MSLRQFNKSRDPHKSSAVIVYGEHGLIMFPRSPKNVQGSVFIDKLLNCILQNFAFYSFWWRLGFQSFEKDRSTLELL